MALPQKSSQKSSYSNPFKGDKPSSQQQKAISSVKGDGASSSQRNAVSSVKGDRGGGSRAVESVPVRTGVDPSPSQTFSPTRASESTPTRYFVSQGGRPIASREAASFQNESVAASFESRSSFGTDEQGVVKVTESVGGRFARGDTSYIQTARNTDYIGSLRQQQSIETTPLRGLQLFGERLSAKKETRKLGTLRSGGGGRSAAANIPASIPASFERNPSGASDFIGKILVRVGTDIEGRTPIQSVRRGAAIGAAGFVTGGTLSAVRAVAPRTGAALIGGTAAVGGASLAYDASRGRGVNPLEAATFGLGFAGGARVGGRVAVRKQSVPGYLGIRDVTPGPRTRVQYNQGGIALTQSGTRQSVVSVFGRPRIGTTTQGTFFTGNAIVSRPEGVVFQGNVFSQRTTAFPLRGRVVRQTQTARGTGVIDFSRGTSAFVSPGQRQVSQVLLSRQNNMGGVGQTGVTIRDSRGMVSASRFAEVLSPETTTTLPTMTRVQRGQPGISFGMLSRGETTQTGFTVQQLVSASQPVSRNQADMILRAAGFEGVGIPRADVMNPRATRLYADPTGGVLSSITTPVPPRTSISLQRPSTQGIAGPDLGFGLGSGARAGGRSFGVAAGLGQTAFQNPISDVRLGQSLFQTGSLRSAQIPALRTGTPTSQNPLQGDFTGTMPRQNSLPRLGNPTLTQTVPTPFTPTTNIPLVPGGITPFTGVPNVLGGGGGASRGRSFRYEVDLQSLLGSTAPTAIRNPLSGFERRGKKKKNRKR